MGKTFRTYLNAETRIVTSHRRSPIDGFGNGHRRSKRTYSCACCLANFAMHSDLISKAFQGTHGKAYLFDKAVNVLTGPVELRQLLTGAHRVSDIYCACCHAKLGWKYVEAFNPAQRYKVGKYAIENVQLIKDNGWDA